MMTAKRAGASRLSGVVGVGILACCLLCGSASSTHGSTWFVRIVSETNTYITSCQAGGTVAWTNASLGGNYQVLVATNLLEDNWAVIQSGVATSTTQSAWVNVDEHADVHRVSVTVKHGGSTLAGYPVQLNDFVTRTTVREGQTSLLGGLTFAQVYGGTYEVKAGDFDAYVNVGQTIDVSADMNVVLYVSRRISSIYPPQSPSSGPPALITDSTPLLTWEAYGAVSTWSYEVSQNGMPIANGTVSSPEVQITSPLGLFDIYTLQLIGYSDYDNRIQVARGTSFFEVRP